MFVVLALDDSSILRRGEPVMADSLLAGVRRAARAIASIAADHQLVIALDSRLHVGLLALQGAAHARVETYSADVFASQFESLIGCLLERELVGLLPRERPVATLKMMAEVDRADPAFALPTTSIGPVYLREEAEHMAAEQGWVFRPDGDKWRRVVASPEPKHIVELRPVAWLLERGAVVIAEGGGPPVTSVDGRRDLAIECAIGGTRVAELLAQELGADLFVCLCEADALCIGSKPDRRPIRHASPAALRALPFTAPSVASTVNAACRFAEATGRTAAIGVLDDLPRIMNGEAGTTVTTAATGIAYGPERQPPGESGARSPSRRFPGRVEV